MASQFKWRQPKIDYLKFAEFSINYKNWFLIPVTLISPFWGVRDSFFRAWIVAAIFAIFVDEVVGNILDTRGVNRLPSAVHSLQFASPFIAYAIVVSFSSLTALRNSAWCLSQLILRALAKSCKIFFLVVLNSPWALKALTTEEYASSSGKIRLVNSWDDRVKSTLHRIRVTKQRSHPIFSTSIYTPDHCNQLALATSWRPVDLGVDYFYQEFSTSKQLTS